MRRLRPRLRPGREVPGSDVRGALVGWRFRGQAWVEGEVLCVLLKDDQVRSSAGDLVDPARPRGGVYVGTVWTTRGGWLHYVDQVGQERRVLLESPFGQAVLEEVRR